MTASGKIKRNKAFKNHILTKKASGRKRKLDQPCFVSKSDHERIRLMLPYA